MQTDTVSKLNSVNFGKFLPANLRRLKRAVVLRIECPVSWRFQITGVDRRPVYNVLEGSVQVVLPNPRHTKHLPGRKTDISDNKWLAGLLRHGLVKGSFIPPGKYAIRQWRDWCRQRKMLVDTVGDFKRRVHKLLEMANIKYRVGAEQTFSA